MKMKLFISEIDIKNFNTCKTFLLKEENIEIILDPSYKENNNKKIKDKNLEELIIDILHKLGMPSHLKGYRYVKESVFLIYKDNSFNYHFMHKLYPKVASNFETSISCVERSIRHAIEISFLRADRDYIEEIFGYSISIEKTKPTNSEFIITVCDKIKLEISKLY